MHLSLRSFNSEQQQQQNLKPSSPSVCCSVLHVCPLLVTKEVSLGSLAKRVERGGRPHSGPEQSPGLSFLRMRSGPEHDAPPRISQPADRSQPGVLASPANSDLLSATLHLLKHILFYLRFFFHRLNHLDASQNISSCNLN